MADQNNKDKISSLTKEFCCLMCSLKLLSGFLKAAWKKNQKEESHPHIHELNCKCLNTLQAYSWISLALHFSCGSHMVPWHQVSTYTIRIILVHDCSDSHDCGCSYFHTSCSCNRCEPCIFWENFHSNMSLAETAWLHSSWYKVDKVDKDFNKVEVSGIPQPHSPTPEGFQ